jgi:hypothetical protein
MHALAEKTVEPAFRRSCEDLAEGWEDLARQQDTLTDLQQPERPAEAGKTLAAPAR